MVPADSDRIPRAPPYSGGPPLHSPSRYGSFTLSAAPFQALPVRPAHTLRSPTTPTPPRRRRFRLRPFRSPLLRTSIFLSSPAGTKMFQFPAFAPCRHGARPSAVRVAPFGHTRINACLRLPVSFRSLLRPSSPPEAKASSVRSSLLSLVNPAPFRPPLTLQPPRLILNSFCLRETAVIVSVSIFLPG